MKQHGEDIRLGLRWIRGRPVESLLLIFGISLGIGATAAGVALAGRTGMEARKVLASTQYREIVVTAREDADEMDLPAVARTNTNLVVLTTADLAAREVSQDVQYAYAANPTGLRFGSVQFGGGQRDGAVFVQRGQAAGQAGGAAAPGAGASGETRTETTVIGDSEGNVMVFQGGPPPEGMTPPEGGEMAFEGQLVQPGDGGPALSVQGDAATGQAAPPGGQRVQGGQGGGPGGGPGDFFGQIEPEPAAPEGPQPVLEEARAWDVTPEFFTANNLVVAQGSLFTTEDMKKNEPLLVLGSTLAKTLFEDGISQGRQVLAMRQLYRIVGVLEPTGTDYDLAAFLPAAMPELQGGQGFAGIMRRFRSFNTSLHFTVADYTKLEEARSQLETYFAKEFGEGAVVINIPRYEAEAARDRSSRLVTVILFLALSALIISAANVTNILFARALRKRRSVGILKALGATRRNVFQLFFLEAMIIGAGGAVVGAGLSVLLSKLMQDTMGFGAIYVSLLAIGILGATALVTALDVFPAMQAARTPASEAIRYE